MGILRTEKTQTTQKLDSSSLLALKKKKEIEAGREGQSSPGTGGRAAREVVFCAALP